MRRATLLIIKRSEEALDKALSFQADDYASLSAKGALALARHEFLSALELGERAVQINPDRAYAYGVMADAQIELGRYPEAIETLQTMVDLRPDMSSYSRVSYIRELHGDTEGALEMMQLAVDSGVPNAENTAWVRTQLANLYFNNGDLERAEMEYQRTLQDRPDYVYALAGLGRVRAAQGEMDEAIEYLTQAVAIMPMPEFVITLGDLYQAAGQPEAAQGQYQLVAVPSRNSIAPMVWIWIWKLPCSMPITINSSMKPSRWPARPMPIAQASMGQMRWRGPFIKMAIMTKPRNILKRPCSSKQKMR